MYSFDSEALEESIIEFYYRELANDFTEFDFPQILEHMVPPLKRIIHESALGTFKDFENAYFYNNPDWEHYEFPLYCTCSTSYVHFDNHDAIMAILKAQYPIYKHAFAGAFHEVECLIKRIESDEDNTEEEDIDLFNDIINVKVPSLPVFDHLDMKALFEIAKEKFFRKDCPYDS